MTQRNHFSTKKDSLAGKSNFYLLMLSEIAEMRIDDSLDIASLSATMAKYIGAVHDHALECQQRVCDLELTVEKLERAVYDLRQIVDTLDSGEIEF